MCMRIVLPARRQATAGIFVLCHFTRANSETVLLDYHAEEVFSKSYYHYRSLL